MRTISELWTPTTRVYDRGDIGHPRRRVLDAGIAWQNYRDSRGAYQPISLARSAPTLPGMAHAWASLPYGLEVADSGARRVFPDRNNRSAYFELPANKFLSGKLFARSGPTLLWQSAPYDVQIRVEPSRVKFDVVVRADPGFDFIELDVAQIGGLNILHYLPHLMVYDSSKPEPQTRKVDVALRNGVLRLGFDLTGLTFPVTIDPTLDLQVGASADDTSSFESSWAANRTGNIAGSLVGGEIADYSARFTGVSGLSGATIDVSYLSLYIYTNSTNVALTKVSAEDATAPAAPTTEADFNGRTLTTAQIDWDPAGAFAVGWNNSPSLNTVIQELADSYDPAVIQIFHKNDGSISSDRFIAGRAYDFNTTLAPKLHIEYTAAGGGTGYSQAIIFG